VTAAATNNIGVVGYEQTQPYAESTHGRCEMKKVSAILCLLEVLLLIGCAARRPENLITAAEKRGQSISNEWVVHTLPEMDAVSVANVTYKEGQTMDVYYPPDFSFRSKLPAVVFANSDNTNEPMFRNRGHYISWGQLAAASGLIAVIYDAEAQHALDDIDDLMGYMQEKGGALGIDRKRIGLWSCGSDAWVAQSILMDTSREYQRNLRCAVFYYAGLDTDEAVVKEWRRDVPQLVVMIGGGSPLANIGYWTEQYVAKADEMGVPVELVEYDEAGWQFDTYLDTDRTREIIQQTLDFMTAHLLGK